MSEQTATTDSADATSLHAEQALYQAGADDGYYEIVGARYTPADPASGEPATASIDLSTVDQTGCLLTHDYATGKTTLKWDGEDLYGNDEDIAIAIEDITHGGLGHQELFNAFQEQMTGSRPVQ